MPTDTDYANVIAPLPFGMDATSNMKYPHPTEPVLKLYQLEAIDVMYLGTLYLHLYR